MFCSTEVLEIMPKSLERTLVAVEHFHNAFGLALDQDDERFQGGQDEVIPTRRNNEVLVTSWEKSTV
jgi:hypothetical protein